MNTVMSEGGSCPAISNVVRPCLVYFARENVDLKKTEDDSETVTVNGRKYKHNKICLK